MADGDNSFFTINANVNPFTLTGLTAETNYTVKVKKSNNDDYWSPDFTFTTPAAYPVPENVTVSEVTPTSALISWTGNADSYDVWYGLISATSVCLQYDDDTHYTNTGFGSDVEETTWGVMYPGNLITGSKLTQIAFYIDSYNKNDITVKIYSGGNNAPEGTPLFSGTLTPPSTTNRILLNVPFAEPVNITPGKNLWITLTEKGTYPIISCTKTDVPNNTWMYNNGWVQQTGYGWMIRGYIESESINPVTMNTISSHEGLSISLEDLSADKNYAVQVRSNYGSDHHSDWVTTTINKALELSNNGTNNDNLVDAWNGKVTNVTLKGRTLFKDGKWNTICLPFPLTAEQLSSSPLAGAEIRTLTNATLNDGELTLYFTPKTGSGSVTSITAGTPYLIKWEKATGYDEANAQTRDIKDPVFNGVTIDKTNRDIEIISSNVWFKGTYTPTLFDNTQGYKLLIGDNNVLYYPQSGAFLGACRAYFMIVQGPSSVRSYVLNFGDDDSATGIIAIGDSQLSTLHSPLSEWYTLDGRRLAAKPTAKGIYLHEGRKVVIK